MWILEVSSFPAEERATGEAPGGSELAPSENGKEAGVAGVEASRKRGTEQEWGPVHLAQVSRSRLLELPYGDGVREG